MGFLRVILAIAVVIAHSESLFGVMFTGGLVAVEVFFMISGFYMTMILDSKYVGSGSYKLFLSNRFLRLYPIFWAVLLLTILISLSSSLLFNDWFTLTPYLNHINEISIETLVFLIFSNISLLGQDIVMFLGLNTENGLMFFTSDFRNTEPPLYTFLLVPQAWTLSIEVTFYLIAPFIVRRSNKVILAIIVASMSIRIFTYLYLGFDNDPWTYRFFPSELGLFLMGSLSYRMHKTLLKNNIFNIKNKYFINIIFFTILIFYQFIPLRSSEYSHYINWTFYFITCVSLPFIFELSKSSKLDTRIGELSYPIYISHLLIIGVITPAITYFQLQKYTGIFSVLSTLLVSYLLVKIISDPIEKIRQKRVKSITT